MKLVFTDSVLAHLFYGAILVSAVITVIYIVLVNRLISILEESHQEVYVRLGEPSLIANNNIVNSARLGWFLIAGKYRQLADRKLTAVGRACRALLALAFCGYVYCTIILTYYWQVLQK
jgi:hypothetical protein